jgi:hypothetical protein
MVSSSSPSPRSSCSALSSSPTFPPMPSPDSFPNSLLWLLAGSPDSAYHIITITSLIIINHISLHLSCHGHHRHRRISVLFLLHITSCNSSLSSLSSTNHISF